MSARDLVAITPLPKDLENLERGFQQIHSDDVHHGSAIHPAGEKGHVGFDGHDLPFQINFNTSRFWPRAGPDEII